MGRVALLGTRRGGRFVRSARRLSYRPIRPTSGAGLEHSTIRTPRWLPVCHIAAGAAISPNHDICRRLRRVRSGGGVARRTVPGPQAPRGGLGHTQAFSSIGGLLVTGAYFLAVHYADALPAIHGAHAPGDICWGYPVFPNHYCPSVGIAGCAEGGGDVETVKIAEAVRRKRKTKTGLCVDVCSKMRAR